MSDPKAARVLVEAAERAIAALRGTDNAPVFADEILGLHTQQAALQALAPNADAAGGRPDLEMTRRQREALPESVK